MAAAAPPAEPERMDVFVLKSLEKVRAQAGFFESDLKEAVDSTSSAWEHFYSAHAVTAFFSFQRSRLPPRWRFPSRLSLLQKRLSMLSALAIQHSALRERARFSRESPWLSRCTNSNFPVRAATMQGGHRR